MIITRCDDKTFGINNVDIRVERCVVETNTINRHGKPFIFGEYNLVPINVFSIHNSSDCQTTGLWKRDLLRIICRIVRRFLLRRIRFGFHHMRKRSDPKCTKKRKAFFSPNSKAMITKRSILRNLQDNFKLLIVHGFNLCLLDNPVFKKEGLRFVQICTHHEHFTLTPPHCTSRYNFADCRHSKTDTHQ